MSDGEFRLVLGGGTGNLGCDWGFSYIAFVRELWVRRRGWGLESGMERVFSRLQFGRVT